MKANRILIALNALLIAILACNLPSAQNPVKPPEPAGPNTDQAPVVLVVTGTPGPTETPSLTPTITLTPTPQVPQVSVTAATNCRTGPGVGYDLLYTMQPGQTAQIIGKYTPDNYWIINMPSGGICWLWGQYAVVTGNVAPLPEYPPPPTPTLSLPANPSGLKVHVACTLVHKASGPLFLIYNEVHAEITWQDNAANEEGYHVYRDDDLIATLSPDTTGVEDDTTLPGLYALGSPPPSVTYSVQAFNSAGDSKKISKSVDCSK